MIYLQRRFRLKHQPDDASLFNAVSSMGDLTRGDETLSPSVYTTISNMIDDVNENFHDGDGCHTVSSVYQRSVLSASASVYTDIDSVKGGIGGTSTVAAADDWVHTDEIMEGSDRALMFGPTKTELSTDEPSQNTSPHFVSNEHLNDIRNMPSSEVIVNSKAHVDKCPQKSMTGGVNVDGDDDDDEPGIIRLTLDGLQQHDMKEAMKGSPVSSFHGMTVMNPSERRSAGPIDVDEGLPDDTIDSLNDDEECIARRMMMLKVEEEELSMAKHHDTLDRIDEDEISILSTKPFSAGSGVSPKKTQELLRREREKEREDRLKRAVMESKEQRRAQRLKEAELVRQRNMQSEVQLRREREAEAQRRLKRTERDRVGSASSNCDSTIGSSNELIGGVKDKKSSTDVPSYCIVCMEGERSHLAVPCMHFSFCEFCVEDMKQRDVKKCPVCNEDNITFSKVFF